MKIHEMLPSRFLKKEDCPQPVLATIANITEEVVDKDSGETKYAMHFQELDKPLALNSTNIQLAAAICQSDEIGNRLVSIRPHLTQYLDCLERHPPILILQCPSKEW